MWNFWFFLASICLKYTNFKALLVSKMTIVALQAVHENGIVYYAKAHVDFPLQQFDHH